MKARAALAHLASRIRLARGVGSVSLAGATHQLLLMLAAAALLALPNSVALALRYPAQPVLESAALHAASFGQYLLLGWAVGLVSTLGQTLVGPRRWLALVGVAVFGVALGQWTLPDSLRSFAAREGNGSAEVLLQVLMLGTSLVPAFAVLVGWGLARPYWRWLAVLVSLLGSTLNNFVLLNDYRGLHLFAALSSYALLCASWSGARHGAARDWLWLNRPVWPSAGPRPSWHAVLLPKYLLLTLCALLAGSAVAFPSGKTVQRLAALEGAPLGELLAQARVALHRRSVHNLARSQLTLEQRPWFEPRAQVAAIAPSSPSLLPRDPLLLLFTLDAVRADLVSKPDDPRFRFFSWLNQNAVTFAQARTPGSGTVPTLSALFSGRYFSQLWWERRGGTEWPHRDTQVRFPELLQQLNVHTMGVTPLLWLVNDYRLVAGLKEEHNLDRGNRNRSKHVLSGALLGWMKQRLAKGWQGPQFLTAHFMDCHAPYDSGKVTTGPQFGRYVSEAERLDSELWAFQSWLAEQGLAERVVWIITADHGEAFGEHNSVHHITTVYEEQLRVPLWIKVPGVSPKLETTPVSVIDLGATVLDLFGAPTPGSFMGQSLVPALRGQQLALTRPIAAETRLRQTMIFPDGFKAIRDLNNGVREVYDLNKDPRELANLVDTAPAKYLALLDLFFDTHLHPDYERHAPYRQ